MKQRLGKRFAAGLLLVAVLLMALVFMAMPARAQSFQVTNRFKSTDTLVSWPTNSPGTNGYGILTGNWVDIRNSGDYIGLVLKYSCPTNCTNLPFTVTLCRSWSANPPTVIQNSNSAAGVAVSKDFEDLWTMPTLTIGPPLGSSYTNGLAYSNSVMTWGTNLPASMFEGCMYVGIYSLTNPIGFVNTYSNFDISITKKIRPTRWP